MELLSDDIQRGRKNEDGRRVRLRCRQNILLLQVIILITFWRCGLRRLSGE
jgi:hypothetical protein